MKLADKKIEALKNCWDGSDNLAYVDQVKGFEDDFKKMAKEMENYSKFLKDSANTYRSTQQRIAQNAKKLQN